MEINVANELHRSSKQLGLFGVKVGDSGPEGLYLSSARTNSEASKKAKVNGAAAVLHRMLNDAAINMLVSESKPYVYCEFRRPSTQVLYQGAYDNDTKCISWAGDAPTNLDALIPLVLFSLHSDSPFTETRTRICSLIENLKCTLCQGQNGFLFQFSNASIFSRDKDGIRPSVLLETVWFWYL